MNEYPAGMVWRNAPDSKPVVISGREMEQTLMLKILVFGLTHFLQK